MIDGIDEAIDANRNDRRSALAQVRKDLIAKGNTGPGIRESAKELGRHYETLARELFDGAAREHDGVAGYAQVIERLGVEFDEFRSELEEAVNAVNGGKAAMNAAMAILNAARDQVDEYGKRLISGRAAAERTPTADSTGVTWDSTDITMDDGSVRADLADVTADETGVTADGNYLLTEDGDVLTTEDGEPIELEGDARDTEDGNTRVTENGDTRVTEDEVRLTGDSDSRVAEQLSFGDTAEGEVILVAARASGWTGRLSQAERVEAIKSLGPVAQTEIQNLIEQVADRRFNDDLTQDALKQLRRLHDTLGQLIEAADQGKPLDDLLAAFGQDRDKFFDLMKRGANVVIAAPAMTFGMVHLLSAMFGLPIDTTVVTGVYALMMQKLWGKRRS